MDFKLKLSDIIKYLGLGVSVLLTCLFVYGYLPYETRMNISALFAKFDLEKISGFLDFALPILALVLIYIIGLVVQTLFRLIYGEGYNGMSINEYCFYVQKFGKHLKTEFPSWVYWSYQPDKVVLELTDQTELKLKSETRSEWLILNQLFQGLHFIFLVSLIVGFCLVDPIWFRYVFISIVALLWISSRWSYALKIPWVSLVLTALQFGFLVSSVFFVKDDPGALDITIDINNLFAVLSGGLVLTFFCARFFARKHVLSIGNVASTDKEALDKILLEKGLPTVFVLIRTNSGEYISETIRHAASQTYPNIKVIVLEDKNRKEKDRSKPESIYDIVTKANDGIEGRRKLNILYYKSEKTGPYDLSMEIRDIYLNYSTDKDISIIMDSDDYFASDNVVQEIVTRMYRTGADICLTGFEVFGKMSLNYSKNYHNVLVKEIANLSHALRYSLWDRVFHKGYLDELFLVSTIGWVKSYRRPVMAWYKDMLDSYGHPYIKELHKEKYQGREFITKYEDFPDFLCLLRKNVRITAIPIPSHLFRKEEGSVTTKVNRDNYDMHIPAFLSMTYKMYDMAKDKYEFVDGAKDIILNKFLVYKYIQYLDVIIKKNMVEKEDERLDYSGSDFASRMSDMLEYIGAEKWTEKVYRSSYEQIMQRSIITFKYKEELQAVLGCELEGHAKPVQEK